jgi:RHS repeat-associated protein
LGRLVSVKDSRHTQAALWSFDSVTGRLTGHSDAAGNVTSMDYYPQGVAGAGRVRVVTDALGNTRRSAYDLLGRVVAQWGSAEYPQGYTYTAHGELHTLRTWRDTGNTNLNSTTWTAPSGGDLTTWIYQTATGLLARKQYADGKGTDYSYDQAHRLATRSWARTVGGNSLTTTYAYNAATGELELVDYSDTTPDVATTYDRLGRPLTVTDATGTRSFVYSATHLRLEEEQLPAFYGSRILRRDYQGAASGELPGRPAGFRLGTASVPAQDHAVTYGYDSFGRLNGVTSPAGAYAYGFATHSDLLATLTGPMHVATRGYEPNRNLLTSLENKVGTTVVSRFDYTLNAIGQRTQRAQSGTAFAQTSTDVFGYNARGEVISATNATLSVRDESFAYDPIGNRFSFTTSLGTTSYTSNALNQYTQISAPFVPSVANPAFDDDGNQTATGLGQAYVWDAENRLIAVQPVIPVNGDKKVHNTYDGQSRRVRRQVFTMTGGSWSLTRDEKFIYDGWNPIAVLGWNSSTSTFDLNKTLTWGLDLSGSLQGAGGVGGLLVVKDGSSIYHYTYDANGNVSEVLDSIGAVVAHYEYKPFGDTHVASGSYAAANEYRFSTKPLDKVSGLYYYGFRYYNPSTGRWPSRDPIGERGGLNLYGMVNNNPLSYWDFLGLSCQVGEKRNWQVTRIGRTAGGSFPEDEAARITREGALLAGFVFATGGLPLATPGTNASGAAEAFGTFVINTAGSELARLPDQSGAVGTSIGLIDYEIQKFNAWVRLSREITVEASWQECERYCLFFTRWADKSGSYTHTISNLPPSASDFTQAAANARTNLYGR